MQKTVTHHRPPRRRPAYESLEKLLDAAEDQLRQEDLRCFTVQRVLQRAGLSPGSLYTRFPAGKTALLRAVQDRYCKRVQPPLLEAINAQKHVKQSLEEAVDHTFSILIEHLMKELGLIRAFMMFAAFDPVMSREGYRMNLERRAAVAEVLAEHRAEIGHPDAEAAIQQAYAMYLLAKHGMLVPPRTTSGLRYGVSDELTLTQVKLWIAHFLRGSGTAPSCTRADSPDG
jgi:AcrR family transcriptional regulator